jgi:hypothetical protein
MLSAYSRVCVSVQKKTQTPDCAVPNAPSSGAGRKGSLPTTNICLRQQHIHNHAYLSIGVASSSGTGRCAVSGAVILGVSGRGYAGSWI